VGLREVLKALGRRWYVLLVGLALTGFGAWYVYDTAPREYTAHSLVLLLPPVATGEAAGSNPFLQLGGLDLTARVVVATYSSTDFADELERVSEHAKVEVTVDDTTRGGVIAVNVTDRGEARTLQTLKYVTGTVTQRLAGLQAEVNVKPADVVRSMELARDTKATPGLQGLIRKLVIVVGAGTALTVLLGLALDTLLQRGRRRRERRGGGNAPPREGPAAGGGTPSAAEPARGEPTPQRQTAAEVDAAASS